ncbi:hypothetical protein [Coraliomargarita akajimensis]|uniref:STAS/SEC14 domain-containing protein n=1 Tax=Coraliomargarita akajimensis (strain DSM 45221 / IAM 15411 / JCM 23193 / KCTC 12865 / 04OKA010-24) TaxID=583355 RepID=D5EP65_CORAD|nr:hypothetical protein [Coraliomargarita akajimensis]ADE55575.1 conserved hypothetical protein [Coraliomargarita akajimensis DSM 45221]
MPFTTEWIEHGVIWRYSGILTGEELIQSNLDIYGDPRFDDLRFQIVDLREITELDVNDRCMKRIAHLDMAAARTNPRIRVAVIEGKAHSHLNNAYLSSVQDGHWPAAAFSSEAEALQWARRHDTDPVLR